MYYIQKIVQLLLIVAVIVLGIENFNVTVTGMSLFFLTELPPTSVVFIIMASALSGVIITAFFSFVKQWRTERDNRKKFSHIKNTIKDLELKSKDLQIVKNELDKLKIDYLSAQNEIRSLKEILTANNSAGKNAVEY